MPFCHANARLLLAALLGAVVAGACANVPPAKKDAEREEMEADQRRRHIDTPLALRASNVFLSEKWKSAEHYVDDGLDMQAGFTTAVYVPNNPRDPENTLQHRGWIREVHSKNREARLIQMYDADWSPLAYLDFEGHMTKAGSPKSADPKTYSVMEAAKAVYGSQSYFAIDNLRYEQTTVQRKLADWTSASPQDRGISLEYKAAVHQLETLDIDDIPRFLYSLESQRFYNEVNKGREARHMARTGGPSEKAENWDPLGGKTLAEHTAREADGPLKGVQK